MENGIVDVSVYVTYCVPCGGKKAFDEMAEAIKGGIPSASVSGKEDDRSGAFEVQINGKNVHSRLQTLAYPDVDHTVEVVKNISLGGPIPNSLLQKPITDCSIS
ncbi:Migration and invasion enhancer 1 [Frankliniella fusca]|uniref:Migration and invasion enhancer 1 n=1 Tax=Frankliniella fusca TaxID=407009 RepID=A0AAE1HW58_9NEOP|nr:Migration and invasion enhancer 1 [Frankliniella fusca]